MVWVKIEDREIERSVTEEIKRVLKDEVTLRWIKSCINLQAEKLVKAKITQILNQRRWKLKNEEGE